MSSRYAYDTVSPSAFGNLSDNLSTHFPTTVLQAFRRSIKRGLTRSQSAFQVVP